MKYYEICERQRKKDKKEDILLILQLFLIPNIFCIIAALQTSIRPLLILGFAEIILIFKVIVENKKNDYSIQQYSFKWDKIKDTYVLYVKVTGPIQSSYVKILELTKIKKHTYKYHSDELHIKNTKIVGKLEKVKDICWKIVMRNQLENYLMEYGHFERC